MLNCVFESFSTKEIPQAVFVEYADTLLPIRNIGSDPVKAERVLSGVREKIGEEAYESVRSCFLAEFPDKEIALIRYLKRGFEVGSPVNSLLSDDAVRPFFKGVRGLWKERMSLIEFLRFSDYNGSLVGIITPQNNVLPLLGAHFIARYPKETFMVYDKNRLLAFVYTEGKGKIVPTNELDLPETTEDEKKYRALWRAFYDTIAIEERKNERLRMGHLPKKFWKNMTEFLSD